MSEHEQVIRFVVEQYEDGFVAYPLGVDGIVLGQGDTAEEALADAQSALQFHLETFGPQNDSPAIQDAFIATSPAA